MFRTINPVSQAHDQHAAHNPSLFLNPPWHAARASCVPAAMDARTGVFKVQLITVKLTHKLKQGAAGAKRAPASQRRWMPSEGYWKSSSTHWSMNPAFRDITTAQRVWLVAMAVT